MQVKFNQIRQSFPNLFRKEFRAQENFRVMPGWSTLVYTTCADITKAASRAGVTTQKYPYITRLDEENGRLVFEIETNNPALKLVLKRHIINPIIAKSAITCMICAANCQHVSIGIKRSLCTVCESNYQRRQYARLDSVEFMSRTEAESRTPMANIAVISITQFGDEPAALKPGWHSVHRIAFDDVDPNQRDCHMPHEHEDLLDDARAQSIVKYIDSVASEADAVIVHCKAGVSRSAAVAKWIATAYGLDFDEDYSDHNKYVFDLLTKAAEM